MGQRMVRSKVGSDHSRNLLTSMMLVFPLLVVYHAGLLVTGGLLNGVDFVTQLILPLLGREHYWWFVLLVTAAFVVALVVLRRKQHFHPRTIIPLLLESTIYALTMGGLISLIMIRFLHLDPPRMAAAVKDAASPLTNLVMSLGAGVYEELVFRLGLLTGLVALFEKVIGMRRVVAVVLGFGLSAAAFSAVHHLGPLGDPVQVWVFTFRFLAGVLFGLLFWFRGFAVAVYTHAIYDIVVLVFGR
jgi:hypothetical protein